jgi:hypothetical protein
MASEIARLNERMVFVDIITVVSVSPLAEKVLTKKELHDAVREAAKRASANPDWKAGKAFELGFTKEGRDFVVCLDYRSNGYYGLLGLPEEVIQERRRVQLKESGLFWRPVRLNLSTYGE